MTIKSQRKIGTFVLLALFALLALLAAVVAAQPAAGAGAGSSGGSVGTTPAAGTEGRGGVAVFLVTPTAGKQGRGGVDAAVTAALASVSPAAGTEGRGGVALSGQPTSATGPRLAEGQILARHGRGAFPVGPPDTTGTQAASTPSSTSTGWIVAGLAVAAALIVGFFVWAANRRRAWRRQTSMESYCAYHPADALC